MRWNPCLKIARLKPAANLPINSRWAIGFDAADPILNLRFGAITRKPDGYLTFIR